MGKPLNENTKVVIEVGEHKGKTGTFLYCCCSGCKIRLTDGTAIYLRNSSHFSAVKSPKTRK